MNFFKMFLKILWACRKEVFMLWIFLMLIGVIVKSTLPLVNLVIYSLLFSIGVCSMVLITLILKDKDK